MGIENHFDMQNTQREALKCVSKILEGQFMYSVGSKKPKRIFGYGSVQYFLPLLKLIEGIHDTLIPKRGLLNLYTQKSFWEPNSGLQTHNSLLCLLCCFHAAWSCVACT